MKHRIALLGLGVVLLGWGSTAWADPILLAAYKSADYSTITGNWTDSSGNNNTATGGLGIVTLTANATPNGSSAVSFTGLGSLPLTTAINPTTNGGLTFLAFLEPAAANSGAIISGGSGGPEWRIQGGKQQLLRANQALFGTSTTTVPTSSFSNINVAFDANGTGSYRYNEAADGTTTGTGFVANVLRIGEMNPGIDRFSGLIAEIRVYAGPLSTLERQAVETEFNNAYVVVPEPGTLALLAFGSMAVMKFRRKKNS